MADVGLTWVPACGSHEAFEIHSSARTVPLKCKCDVQGHVREPLYLFRYGPGAETDANLRGSQKVVQEPLSFPSSLSFDSP